MRARYDPTGTTRVYFGRGLFPGADALGNINPRQKSEGSICFIDQQALRGDGTGQPEGEGGGEGCGGGGVGGNAVTETHQAISPCSSSCSLLWSFCRSCSSEPESSVPFGPARSRSQCLAGTLAGLSQVACRLAW